MSPSELALAFILLTAPPGAPEADPPADQWASIQKAVHSLAQEWEILDKNETKFILARSDEFGKDLNILRRRHESELTLRRQDDGGGIDFEQIVRTLNQIGYDGPLSVEWEDSGMQRERGAVEALKLVQSVNFAPSAQAFDKAFAKE